MLGLTQQCALPTAPLALLMTLVVSLVECFFGYILYRLALATMGLLLGVAAGVALLNQFVAAPSNLDYLVVCSSLGLLLAVLSWFIYRLMFSLLILCAGGLLIAQAMTSVGGESWIAVVIGFSALILAVLGFIYLKGIFILLSAISGGLTSAFAVGALLVGSAALDPRSEAPNWTALWIVIATGLFVAALGVYAQARLAGMLRTPFVPKPSAPPRPGLKMGRGRRR